MTRIEALTAAMRATPVVTRDVVGLAGFVAVVHGIDMMFEPAAWIVAGLGMVVYAVAMARGARLK